MLISDISSGELSEIQWCDICRGHVPGCCDDCKRPFLPTEPRYRSQTFHYHPGSIGGVAGTRSVQKELCVACYRADHAKAYPNGKVPDLPDRGMDPRFFAAQLAERRRERWKSIAAGLQIGDDDREFLEAVMTVGLRFM